MPRKLTPFQRFCINLAINDFALIHVLTARTHTPYRSGFPGKHAGYAGWSKEDGVYRPTEDAACWAIRQPFKAALLIAPDGIELSRRAERAMLYPTLKTCAHCLELKEAKEFTRKFDARDKLHPYCKTCRNTMKRQSERQKAYEVIAMPTVEKRKKAA